MDNNENTGEYDNVTYVDNNENNGEYDNVTYVDNNVIRNEEMEKKINNLDKRMTRTELILQKLSSQMDFICSVEAKNNSKLKEEINKVRNKVYEVSSSNLVFSNIKDSKVSSSNLFFFNKKDSLPFSVILEKNAKSKSRVNAIIEHRKLVDKKAKEKSRDIMEKKQYVKDILSEYGDGHEDLENIQIGLIGLTSSPYRTPSYKEYDIVYTEGIVKTYVRNIKYNLKRMKIDLSKILNISFHGKLITEFLIYKDYKDEFISKLNRFPKYVKVLEKFDPLKSTEKLSKEESEKIELNLINNINGILSRNGCRDSVKDFYYNYLLNSNFIYMKSYVEQILSSQPSMASDNRVVSNSDISAIPDNNDEDISITESNENIDNNENNDNVNNSNGASLLQNNMDFEGEGTDHFEEDDINPTMAIENNDENDITSTMAIENNGENDITPTIAVDNNDENDITPTIAIDNNDENDISTLESIVVPPTNSSFTSSNNYDHNNLIGFSNENNLKENNSNFKIDDKELNKIEKLIKDKFKSLNNKKLNNTLKNNKITSTDVALAIKKQYGNNIKPIQRGKRTKTLTQSSGNTSLSISSDVTPTAKVVIPIVEEGINLQNNSSSDYESQSNSSGSVYSPSNLSELSESESS